MGDMAAEAQTRNREFKAPDYLRECELYLQSRAGLNLRSAVLYVDIVGSTKLSIYLSQAELEFVIRTFWRQMSEVVRMHKGLVFKYVGDAVIALFPDDLDGAEAAVRCGQKMLQSVEQIINPRLTSVGIPAIRVKIGIDRGDSLVISEESGHVDLIGFPLSMTAKVTAMARPNSILVGQGVVEATESGPAKDEHTFSIYHVATWNFLELNKRDLVYRIYAVDVQPKRNGGRLVADQ